MNAVINSVMVRSLIFVFIWWILADGNNASWLLGIPAIAIALISSLILIPPTTFSGYRLLGFIPFFITRSIIGGIDVAWRAFHPHMPITPDLIKYPIQLPTGLPRVLMITMINLLPGTLCVVTDDSSLQIHVLDANKDFITEIKEVEHSIARIFGLSINSPIPGES